MPSWSADSLRETLTSYSEDDIKEGILPCKLVKVDAKPDNTNQHQR